MRHKEQIKTRPNIFNMDTLINDMKSITKLKDQLKLQPFKMKKFYIFKLGHLFTAESGQRSLNAGKQVDFSVNHQGDVDLFVKRFLEVENELCKK